MLGKALAFCVGTASIHLLPSVGAAPAAALPAVAAACLIRRRPALAAFLAGCAAALHGAAAALEGAWPCARDREVVVIEGRIAEPAVVRPDRTEFDVVVAAAPGTPPGFDRVRLSWYEAQALPRAGERWRLGARLRCPRGFANPGAADRELALLRAGIDATGYVTGVREPERLAEGTAQRIERLRERVAGSIERSLEPGASAAVLQGLAVGLRGNIPDGVWEALAATGLAHLVAISGLHVTGCALAALILLRTAWQRGMLPATRWRPVAETVTVISVTSAYALLSGASLPALRTVAMVALFHALRSLRRNVAASESLALAAAVLVAADPLAVTSAGFWLSFVATAGLLAAGSAAPGWRGRAGQFVRAQSAVTLLLAPVLAATFGRLSLVAPFLNAIAIPAFSVLLLPAVLIGTALALVAPAAPAMLWQALAAALDILWPQLERIAGWPAASIAPAAQSMAFVAGAGVLALAALLVPITGLRVLACVALAGLACGRGVPSPPGGFTLTVLDVGQGEAAVVETAAHVLVFDTGPRWRGGMVAARVSLLPFLRARGIRRIDRLVVSHEDADHAGGAAAVEQAFDVALRMTAPGGRRAADTECVAGDAWDWDGIAFRVLHPPPRFEGDDNDRSCAIHVRGPGGAALLLADPEAAAEVALTQHPVSADVVLVPHHGSRTSSSPGLVAAVSARIGIVSAGFGNRWDLPRADVVARWRAAGTTVLGTAGQGAVRIRFAPRNAPLAIEAERRDEPHWWRAGSGR
jgi:competence protein ComEC